MADLEGGDKPARLAAIQVLSQRLLPDVLNRLKALLEKGPDGNFVEPDADIRAAAGGAVDRIEQARSIYSGAETLFFGLGLGAVLVLVAIGLAITFGVMGVINMAHGELMMLGAYTTYVVQTLMPNHIGWSIAVAIPAAFLVSGLTGVLIERTIIRFLYGRPLETLLATFGVSLVLQQAVRSIFGAQNVPVENPAWLSGGVAAMSNLTLPYNRLAIIAFAVLVLAGVSALIARTRLGLFVRGVTQNRKMAACMGVNTARIDTYAFALGSGIAGLAGCALSQVGNVGPDLGQGYIVDSFMVVVLGGVGQLAGTVYAALGLGVLNKLLEGWQGAVLAKIMVLVFIVIFIQKRPQGIFAMKGRSAEA
jgi:urea transport system permease protein